MRPRLINRSSSIVFDVGAAGVRVCQLRARGSRFSLNDALHVETPTGDSSGADASLAPDCTRFARLVGQGRFAGREVALVLSPPEVHFHALHVPDEIFTKSPRRVEDALAWEIARETRTESQELEVRYWRLPSGHREGLNVMSVAVSKRQTLAWVREFHDRELTLRRLDVSPCALARAATWSWQPQPDEIWGILDIGHRRTNLTTLVGDTPVYIRTAAVAAKQWTDALARTFEVSPAEAERIKRTHGIQVHAGAAVGAGPDSLTGAEDIASVSFSVLRDSLDQLVHAVNLCLTYALESYPDRTIGRLFLAGGGSQLVGLPEFLQAYLDVPVNRLDVTPESFCDGQAPSLAGQSIAAATAIGAAMLDLEAGR